MLIVDDDMDIQTLVETIFSIDPRFTVAGSAESAEEALTMARSLQPEVIVLDHRLKGAMTGFDALPLIKQAAPDAKIILFTAHAELQPRAHKEKAVDAFLLKTDVRQLLSRAQHLTNMLSLI